MNRETNISACERENHFTHTADHVVVFYSDDEPKHLPRTNDHEVAQAEWWRWRCKRRTSEQ